MKVKQKFRRKLYRRIKTMPYKIWKDKFLWGDCIDDNVLGLADTAIEGPMDDLFTNILPGGIGDDLRAKNKSSRRKG